MRTFILHPLSCILVALSLATTAHADAFDDALAEVGKQHRATVAEVATIKESLTVAQATIAARDKALSDMLATVNDLKAQIAALQPKPTYTVAPGGSIQAALDKAPAGSVVTVAPGTYSQTVNVPAGKTLKLTADVRIKGKVTNAGTMIGGVVSDVAATNSRAGAAVRLTANGATLDGVTIERIDGCGVGFDGIDNATVKGCTIQDVTRSPYLFGGTQQKQASGVKFTGNTVRRYNTAKLRWGGDEGICKITRTTGLVFTGNKISEGWGPGVWTDIHNSRMLIDGNEVWNLYGNTTTGGPVGVYVEICDDFGTVSNNTVRGVAGDGILIAESFGGRVVNNKADTTIALRRLHNRNAETGKMELRVFDTMETGRKTYVQCELKDIEFSGNACPKYDWLSIGIWPGYPLNSAGTDSTGQNVKPWNATFTGWLAGQNITYGAGNTK